MEVEEYDGGFRLDNGVLRVTVDARGLVVSVVDLVAGRETVAPGARRICSRSTRICPTDGTRGTSMPSTATR